MRKKTEKTNIPHSIFEGSNALVSALIAWVVLLCLPGQTFTQNVGIGAPTPVARLHIEVPSGFSSPVLQVNQQGAATPYLIILPNGNVGIGVATPSEALDVAGNIQFSGALMPGGNAGTAGQVLVSQGPGTAPVWSTPKRSDSVCASVATNFVQKWTGTELCNSIIYDNGTKVGIGTTSPRAKLDVIGSAVIGASGSLPNGVVGELHLGRQLASPGTVGEITRLALQPYGHIGGPFKLVNRDNSTNAYLDLRYGTSNLVTVVHNGKVGIGTTSPGAKLDVVGAIRQSAPDPTTILFHATNESGTPSTDGFRIRFEDHFFGPSFDAMIIEKTDGNQADPDGGIAFVNTGNDGVVESALVIRGSGNVGIGTASPSYQLQLSLNSAAKPGSNTWTVISDERLKNITGTYNKGLKELLQLQPITYYYKNSPDSLFDPRVLEKENVGFVAQQVAKVFPEAVDTAANGYLGLNIHPILIAYLNAIKELKQENDALKKELQAYQKQLEELTRIVTSLRNNTRVLTKNKR